MSQSPDLSKAVKVDSEDQKFPECKEHPLGEHGSTLDPDGCGHCNGCHSGDCPGHWIGCPGC